MTANGLVGWFNFNAGKDEKMTGRYIVFALFLVMLIVGLASGDFLETWRNGATL
jgi:preprotein translocase subunit Sec61beta